MVFALISSYFLCLIGRFFKEEEKNIKANYFILIAILILICIAGFRTNIGDTYVYKSGYEKFLGQTLSEAIEGKGDIGFYILTYGLYKISANPQFMIFVIAAITQILYFKFFNKYRNYLELQVFIYIASGYYFVTMNGIRQSLAAGVVALSAVYIIKNEKLKFSIATLIAMMLHQSAFIMFIVYFICRMKPWSKKLFIMILLAVLGTILFYELLPMLERILSGTNYEHYIKVFTEGTEKGANVMRLLVSMVPVILAFLNKNNMEDTTFNRVFINMAIINGVFMLFSMRTWIFARFNIYFNLFNCIFIPGLIEQWKNEKDRKLIYGGLILCYFIFFILEQLPAERIILLGL